MEISKEGFAPIHIIVQTEEEADFIFHLLFRSVSLERYCKRYDLDDAGMKLSAEIYEQFSKHHSPQNKWKIKGDKWK